MKHKIIKNVNLSVQNLDFPISIKEITRNLKYLH